MLFSVAAPPASIVMVTVRPELEVAASPTVERSFNGTLLGGAAKVMVCGAFAMTSVSLTVPW